MWVSDTGKTPWPARHSRRCALPPAAPYRESYRGAQSCLEGGPIRNFSLAFRATQIDSACACEERAASLPQRLESSP